MLNGIRSDMGRSNASTCNIPQSKAHPAKNAIAARGASIRFQR